MPTYAANSATVVDLQGFSAGNAPDCQFGDPARFSGASVQIPPCEDFCIKAISLMLLDDHRLILLRFVRSEFTKIR
jgi:hypothetical protein